MSRKVYLARLREIREDRGISISEMMERLGVTLDCYRNDESGASTPPFAKLVQIADILNVSVDHLIGHDTKRCADTTAEQVCIYTGLSPEAVRGLHNSRGIRMIWRIRT